MVQNSGTGTVSAKRDSYFLQDNKGRTTAVGKQKKVNRARNTEQGK